MINGRYYGDTQHDSDRGVGRDGESNFCREWLGTDRRPSRLDVDDTLTTQLAVWFRYVSRRDEVDIETLTAGIDGELQLQQELVSPAEPHDTTVQIDSFREPFGHSFAEIF